ncbi:MAG: hypothetical protein ACLQT7_03875 [Candidatus Dormibacteria bacterium]
MALVLISFLDGEIVRAEVDDLSFDRTLLEAEVRGADPNNERALFPLTAIRQLLVGQPLPVPEDLPGWDRAAFHFVDGQVLRASVAPDSVLGRFGGLWRAVEPGIPELRTLGIPYSSLKGVFKLRQWDSRPVNARSGTDTHLSQVARILAEREGSGVGAAPPPERPHPLISRLRP